MIETDPLRDCRWRRILSSSSSGDARSVPAARWLDDEPGARDSIIGWQGVTYDEIKVMIPQGNGGTRTFYVGQPDLGHP
jgi:hypothetical protein